MFIVNFRYYTPVFLALRIVYIVLVYFIDSSIIRKQKYTHVTVWMNQGLDACSAKSLHLVTNSASSIRFTSSC
jgi:hypothetical protein